MQGDLRGHRVGGRRVEGLSSRSASGSSAAPSPAASPLRRPYLLVTLGVLSLVTLIAFEAMVTGTPVRALCGKLWVPSRDPEKFPVCPTCKEIYESLGG